MSIGVLGGTFDPPHQAHCEISLRAIDQYGLDKVLFVPSKNPWQKSVTTSYDLNFEILFINFFPLLSVTSTTSYPFSEKCFIKLIAGNICPPVPPAEKIIFLLIFKKSCRIFSCKI